MKVYVVTEGSYSSWTLTVYVSEEKAQARVQAFEQVNPRVPGENRMYGCTYEELEVIE